MRGVVFIFLISLLAPATIDVTVSETTTLMPGPKLQFNEERAVEVLLSTSMDVIQHTNLELWKLYLQRQALRGSGPYEIGFLVRTTEERYRKMVDLYNTSIMMDISLRTREHIMHLQDIEKLHWDIMHLANMLHEVERKYKIKPQQLDKRVIYPYGISPSTSPTPTTPTKPTTPTTPKTPTSTNAGNVTTTTTMKTTT